MELNDEVRAKVAEAGELLIRAAAVLGTLTRYDQQALAVATEGKLVDSLAWAIEGAAMLSPQVGESLTTHPPAGFIGHISTPRT